jgi:hypothetical protein
MAKKTLLALLIIVTGTVIVFLPDSDYRLFSLSTAHGPSALDAFGLVLILVPYIYLVCRAWQKRSALAKWSNRALFKTGLFFFGLGAGLVIASVTGDFQNWWVVGAAMMTVIQIPIFIKTLRR